MKKWIIMLLLAALLLCGCQQPQATTDTPAATAPTTTQTTPTQPTTLPQLEYQSAFCNFGELYGNTYDSKRSTTTQYNGVTYHFTTNIDEQSRLEIVLESDKLITYLLSDHPDWHPQLTVCFRKGEYTARVLDHTLYIGTDQFKTQEYAIGMAQMVFGHDVNYGIVYAQGLKTSQAFGYETAMPSDSLEEALVLCDRSPIFLDMNYACFLSDYADQNTIQKVKALSMYFFQWLEENNKLDLLTDYSDKAYCAYLSQFLAANGKSPYDNSDLNETIFYHGGPALRLVWENEDATYYVNYNFKVQYQEAHFPGDMLKSGYANLRQLVVDYQLQIEYIESILGKYENEDSRVDVQFTERFVSQMYTAAQYTEYFNLIEMFSAGPFLHEYGHYLLRDTDIDSWLNELICYYFGYDPVNPQLSYQWEDLVTQFKQISVQNPNDNVEAFLMQVLRDHLGHPINWEDQKDFNYIISAWVVATKAYPDLTNPNGGGYSKYSFMSYLIEKADRQQTLDAITGNTPVETFGADWETLIADWEAELRTQYAWLAEYFYI